MVKIRLKLKGRKNAPTYRIVAIDSRKKRNGEYLEDLGFYNPVNKPVLLNIDKDRYNYWVSKGAQVSESVTKLMDGTYKYVKYNPNAKKEEAAKAPEEAQAEAPETQNEEKTA